LAVEMSVRRWVACNAWGVRLEVENMLGRTPEASWEAIDVNQLSLNSTHPSSVLQVDGTSEAGHAPGRRAT
jgi:hypothetical protein